MSTVAHEADCRNISKVNNNTCNFQVSCIVLSAIIYYLTIVAALICMVIPFTTLTIMKMKEIENLDNNNLYHINTMLLDK